MIEIKEFQGFKFIQKDGLTQSCVPALPNGYWRQMIPDGIEPENALVLGLGAGTVCAELKAMFPKIQIEAVENNAQMLKLARKEFGVNELVEKVYNANAFDFVKSHPTRYSLVIVDLYDGFNFSLRTISDEFLHYCKMLLKEGGWLTVNLPNLEMCERQFNAVKKSETNKIYFFQLDTLIH